MMKTCWIATLLLSAHAFGADLPSEVAKVVEARKASLAEVEKAYVRELEELLQKYQKSGDKKGEEAVSRLIAEVGKQPGATAEGDDKEEVAALAKIFGSWKRDTDFTLWVFNENKAGTFKGTEPFSFSYDSKKKEIRVVAGKWVDEMTYNSTTDTLRGVDANGRKYKLSRVK